MWTEGLQWWRKSKQLEKCRNGTALSPCPGSERHEAARTCTWVALINLSVETVVRAVYRLHGDRLFSLCAWAGPNGEGDCVLAPRGAESAPGLERGFPAACAAVTDTEQLAGCLLLGQPQMWGRHSRVVRVSEAGFGVAATGCSC